MSNSEVLKTIKAFEKYISSVVGDIRSNRNRTSSIMTYSVESPSPEFNLYIPTVPFQSVPVETSSSPAANPPPDLIGIGGGTGLGSPGLVPGLSNGFSGSQAHIISSSSPLPTQSNLSGSGSVTSYYGSTSQLHTVSPTAPPFIPKTNYPNGK